MDRIENVRTTDLLDGPSRAAGAPDAAKPPKKKRTGKSLDSAEMMALHGRLLDWFYQERDRQAVNRYQMSVDEDYYDSLQWSDEDAQELIDRAQAPLVFNKVKPAINWLLGTEKKLRVDNKVMPREEADEQLAEVKTKLFKYVGDANRWPFARSDAFEECVIAGLGWVEEGVNTEPGSELLYVGYESWRNVLHDSVGAKRRDINDGGRYLFRWRWIDVDVAVAMFPNRKSVIESSALDADEIAEKDEDIWYLGSRVNVDETGDGRFMRNRWSTSTSESGPNRRKRVKVIECWYKDPRQAKVMRGEEGYDGEIYDEANADHVAAVTDERVSLSSTLHMQMCVMVMTESQVLWHGETPYRHNRFPLTPLWCYRRKRDGMPYGYVRDIRDAQDDYNKRASKALFILSTNRVLYEEGAFDAKYIETVREEVARPDGMIAYKAGKKIEIQQDKELAQEHLALMDRDAKMIQDISGITDENMGRQTNASSGIALERRQDQGAVVTFGLFDNLRYSDQISGEKRLSLIEQFYTAQKVVRIVGEKKPIEWLPVNKVDPATGQMLNDITASKADFIIGEQDYRASLRQAMFEQLMDMLSKIAPVAPQAAINLLDLVVEMADIPNREEFVARIRKINGQTDPARKPTPQEQEQAAKAQAMADRQSQLALDKLEAEVGKLRSQGGQIDAERFKTVVTGLYETLQAAQIVATVPNVTLAADVIAQDAGFQPTPGTSPQIPQPTGTLPAMTPQSMHGDYIGAAGPGAAAAAGGTTDIPPQPEQAGGAQAGIETLRNDGAQP